jgi:hypothetical protein
MRFVLSLALAALSLPVGAQTVSFDFEQPTASLPVGWTTMHAPDGAANAFSPEPRGGAHSFRLSQPDPGEWDAIRYLVPESVWAGADSLHLTGWLRTENVTGASGALSGYAGLWLRVDGPEPGDARVLAFDNMRGRGPHGTTGWARYDVRLPVPKAAKAVFLGVLLSGGGTVWADDLELKPIR